MSTDATERKRYSFDGHGINGPDEYRTRLLTLTEAGHAAGIGPILESMLNDGLGPVIPLVAVRIEELRAELRAERISYGELAELAGLVPYIDPGDVELLEAAGVPEVPA